MSWRPLPVPKSNSEEAGLKYFLLGAFSTGFIVYGIALVFGATGTTSLSAIVTAASNGTTNLLLLTIGSALILVATQFQDCGGALPHVDA